VGSNITPEVSRSAQVLALLGISAATIHHSPDPVRIASALAGLLFVSYSSLRTNVSYSDACVLHKAWRIATNNKATTVGLSELLAVREQIATEYHAPKCRSEAEILECIRNLCGLRAMQKDGDEDRYPLREKVIFFADGHVPP
jgi:hypothetical protein